MTEFEKDMLTWLCYNNASHCAPKRKRQRRLRKALAKLCYIAGDRLNRGTNEICPACKAC